MSYSIHCFVAGAIDEEDSEGDLFAENYFKMINSPIIAFCAVLITIGGFVKVVREDRAAMVVSNMLIIIIPFLCWILVILDTVAIPEEILTMYGKGTEFIGKFVYVILFLVIIVLLVGAMYVFQNVKLMMT